MSPGYVMATCAKAAVDNTPVALLVEHPTHNRRLMGSMPDSVTNFC